MSAGLGRVVRSGVGRRRVQTVVMTLTTLLAVTASVLAVGLLVASNEPFAKAFARQHGAHLMVTFDPAKATADQLAATAHATGVTEASGPYAVVELEPVIVKTHDGGFPVHARLPAFTVAARPADTTGLDRLELTAGRYATGPDEIVWSAGNGPFAVGDQIEYPDAPGQPTLTIVGLARSVTDSSTAWALPATVTALTPKDKGRLQMLYRLSKAGTEADLTTGQQAIAATLPDGAVQSSASYLTAKTGSERVAGVFAPFVVAFGVIGLIMSVLIIGIVVGGAVGSATRRIGILKALGYSPGQVCRAYVMQALIPAAAGALAAVPLGNLAAVPILNDEGDAFGTGFVGLDWWVSVVVPVAALAAVAVTAFVPALRAGRLRTVDALAVGRTPSLGRGRAARTLLGRLPLPRAMSLGLANPFTRPGRSATIAAAVALGALGVTFGLGLALSIGEVQAAMNKRTAGDVEVGVMNAAGPPPPPGLPARPAVDQAAIEAAIKAEPGTGRYFAQTFGDATVTGLTGTTELVLFAGDSSWASYDVIEGRWIGAAGEAVVPTAFLRASGAHIGDTLTVTSGGRSASVTIVGEVLDLSGDGRRVIADAGPFTGWTFDGPRGGTRYQIELAAGTDLQQYTASLQQKLEPVGGHADINAAEISQTVVAIDSLAGLLALMLVAVAGLGVLNTVVLDTRERVHELGVFKALGMAPRQTVAMVLTSVGGLGLVAGLAGVPAGIALHDWVLPAMANAADTRFPAHIIDVYSPGLLVPLLFGGLLIAVGGALMPAGWAARTSTARALRTE
ncbi:ABC transporter permease [Dactylosporangium vinaceum]|uniref:FtsX-like permease family protein n=1 Tax=Dactylosporangium vinaceum TaxID=53362 RepID=A0ABV5MBZ6_9ACTN|nr:ABC transporter permease [Dactylosporangium vinaceum]UAC01338.1 ABC transporter permease [Dactylosporangium vinaceum]